MKKISRSSHHSLNELNITPLLDLAFVLLVIFIITTPQMVNNMEMNLPSSQIPSPTDQPPAKPHQIIVRSSGEVLLNNHPLSLEQLRGALTTLKASEPDAAVVIRGAPSADYQHVIRVLDILQQLDLNKLGLATETGS